MKLRPVLFARAAAVAAAAVAALPASGAEVFVHRFYSASTRGHFFTADPVEAEHLRITTSGWRDEGRAWLVSNSPGAGLTPVYRFWSSSAKGHFFTASEAEKNHLVANASDKWTYEGVAWWGPPANAAGAVPVYRFWAPGARHHFFTIDRAERDALVANASSTWTYEGVAFGAWPTGGTAAGTLTASSGGRTWVYFSSGGTATVTAAAPATGALSVPSSLGGLSVTAIGDGAFAGNDGLTSVSLPASVRTIGTGAFFGCSALSSVSIGAGVSSIGDWAFSWCPALASFSVASGNGTFSARSGVLYRNGGKTLVRFPGGKSGAFSIPSGVTAVAPGAFCGASAVTRVTLPASLASVGDRAFAHCEALQSFAVASGSGSFSAPGGTLYGDGGATLVQVPRAVSGSFAVPSGVRKVGPSAFAGCSGLTAVSLPSSLRETGGGAFLDCTALKTLDAAAGSSGPVGDEAFLWCASLVSAVLPPGATALGGRAFARCGALVEFDPGSALSSVGEGAFEGDAALVRAAFRSPLSSVGAFAFAGCSSLGSADLGSASPAVGDGAFLDAARLGSVRWRGNAPASAPARIYQGTPASCVTALDASSRGWNGSPGSTALPAAWPLSGPARRPIGRVTSDIPVYRLFSTSEKGHFFTSSAGERDALLRSGTGWTDEGTAWRAAPFAEYGTLPVHRFCRKGSSAHFYTASDAEMRSLVRTGAATWTYEGVAFHVPGAAGAGTSPVWRFWGAGPKRHFYTASAAEKENLERTASSSWTCEGVAFLAWTAPRSLSLAKACAAPVADACVPAEASGPAKADEEPRVAVAASGPEFPAVASAAVPAALPAGGATAVEAGGALVEFRADAPSAAEIAACGPAPFPDGAAPELALGPLPDGTETVSLWFSRGGGETVLPVAPGGVLSFAVPVSDEWLWLRVLDDDGNSLLSVWLRAVP